MAAAATAGRAGLSLTPYRDYRGVPVVGAWRWLADRDLGIASEIDAAQAFQPLHALERCSPSCSGCSRWPAPRR